MSDLICRQAAIDLIESIETERLKGNIELIYAPAIKGLRALPPAQPEIKQQAINSSDCIDRRAALDALRKMQTYKLFSGDDMLLIDQAGAQTELMLLSSAQPLEDIHREKEQAHYCGYEDGKAAQWDWLKTEIKRMKMTYTICINHDYYTGYMSALSAVEGCIAQLEGDAE